MQQKNENTFILEKYKPIADMIVSTFGSNCEVVIHDLNQVQSSLIYIKGSVTGRELGAPTTEVILKELRQHGDNVKDKLGYTTRSRDGKFIKTSVSFIRNVEGKVIGFLGINFDITPFTMVNQILSEFSATNDMNHIEEPLTESYAKNIEEVFENIIQSTLAKIEVPINRMSRDDKIFFVQKLDATGGFMIHGAVDRIADLLEVSKQTIYNYLEESRGD